MTEGNTLAANTAFSHFYTSKIPAQMSGDLYKFFVNHKSASDIITHGF